MIDTRSRLLREINISMNNTQCRDHEAPASQSFEDEGSLNRVLFLPLHLTYLYSNNVKIETAKAALGFKSIGARPFTPTSPRAMSLIVDGHGWLFIVDLFPGAKLGLGLRASPETWLTSIKASIAKVFGKGPVILHPPTSCQKCILGF